MTMQDECYTPKNIKSFFLNSCNDVLKDANKCQNAFVAFYEGFGQKDPNTVTESDYNAYFGILPVVSAPNSALFWSGVINVIEKVSQYPGISSSATQASSLIINKMYASYNVMCWCGNTTDYFDFYNPCPPTPTYMFWAQFSILLGKSATGVAFWAAYGNRDGGAYSPDSFFAKYELPNMVKVKRLVVIDIYNPNKKGEKCEQGSLALLRNEAVNIYGNDGYQCSVINGDPTDPKQVDTLAAATYAIIQKERQG